MIDQRFFCSEGQINIITARAGALTQINSTSRSMHTTNDRDRSISAWSTAFS